MKKWAFVTVVLYVAALLAATVPLWFAAFGWGSGGWRQEPDAMRAFLAHQGYWIWIGVAAAGQVLLLVVPVGVAEGRPIGRRRILVPAVTSALLLGIMTVTAAASIALAIGGDDGGTAFVLRGTGDAAILSVLGAYLLASWLGWGLLFRRFLREADPEARVRRLTSWLLRGSILELLVAVPAHVISRQRDDCCAPIGTAFGMATGATIMLMSFGPGVLFLFAARMPRLRSRE